MKKAAATRQTLLNSAFELIYTKGYQTTSVDEILATTEVTKGAFYYHFKSKDEMGLAIISEVILPVMESTLIQPIAGSQNPVKDIYALVKSLLFETPFLRPEYGCPVDNMAQESPHLQKEFSRALQRVVEACNKGIAACVDNGKKVGTIRKNVNSEQVAYFVMSGYWGIRSVGKLYEHTASYDIFLKALKQYLKSLE